MSRAAEITAERRAELDRFYREGGLRAMASSLVHYDEATCPHPGCGHRMEWIDFKLELFHDPEGVYKPLVTTWWQGVGFAGRCPACGGWVHFRTTGMEALEPDEAERLPRLPEGWEAVAQFG